MFKPSAVLAVLLALVVPSFFRPVALAAEVKPLPLATGKIVLSPNLTAKAKGLHTLFISIYDPTSSMPMPYAAMKIDLAQDATGAFQSFELGGDKLMVMGQGDAPKLMNIKVKLPHSGGAGPDQPGDLVGMAKAVKSGAKNLTITIDKAI